MNPAPLLIPAIVAAAAPAGVGRAPLPSPEYMAGLLEEESTRWCRDLIDYCVDENGNATVSTASFTVSALKCRRVPEAKAACSFVSARNNRGQPASREHCTATLSEHRDPYGAVGWQFARRPWHRESLSPNPVLACN